MSRHKKRKPFSRRPCPQRQFKNKCRRIEKELLNSLSRCNCAFSGQVSITECRCTACLTALLDHMRATSEDSRPTPERQRLLTARAYIRLELDETEATDKCESESGCQFPGLALMPYKAWLDASFPHSPQCLQEVFARIDAMLKEHVA